ncbi:hypothetical protein bcgnr5380_57200 [Bacillus cereus]
MFDLCLFDLDNTLLRTDDLEDIRLQGLGRIGDPNYASQLVGRFGVSGERHIYTLQHLSSLRSKWPNMRFGVFTRAPRAYTNAIVPHAYPNFLWDAVICFEEVQKGFHKPNGEGIRMAMNQFGIRDPQRVVMVGDESADVRAAYNAGCYAVLDKASWPFRWDGNKHWRALELIPDAVIEGPNELLPVLSDIGAHAPKLEWELNLSFNGIGQPRFSEINHFFPRELGLDNEHVKISSAGRHFSDWGSLDARRVWHDLTANLHQHKDAVDFPVQWCNTVHDFVRKSFPLLNFFKQSVTVAAIPARPDRLPRMQHFIVQLYNDFRGRPPLGATHDAVQFSTTLLGYTAGVRSHSGDHLKRLERFENVRDHLVVADGANVAGRDFVIIDDICTSGATLMYAEKRLKEAGARKVVLFSLAKNVSNVL